MENNVRGVDKAQLSKVSTIIEESAGNLARKFAQLDAIVDSTKSFYDSPAGTAFRLAYATYRENYDVATKNILTYSEDLINASSSYSDFETKTVATVNSFETSTIDLYERRW